MYRYLITALLIMFTAAVSAQESESTDDSDAPPGESQAAAEEDDADLDDEQRDSLLRIADKCPVHKTLEASSKIATRLLQD